MTGPTFAPAAEISLCLTCERPEEECVGGDPDCNRGRVYYYEPDRERRREWLKEYGKRRRQREETDERHAV